MSNRDAASSRRRFLARAGAGALLAAAGPLCIGAHAQSPDGGTLSIGLLRAPASGIIDLTEQHGWFKQAGVSLNEFLFAAAAGPKIIQALGSGGIGLSFVNSTAALLGLAGGVMPLRFISIPTDPSRPLCAARSARHRQRAQTCRQARRGNRRPRLTAMRFDPSCPVILAAALALATVPPPAGAQVAPTSAEQSAYSGVFAAAARGDIAGIERLVAAGERIDARDGHGRTPLHVATFLGQRDAMRALVRAGADPNALDRDRYDIVTIAAVADDVATLATALDIGCSAANVTSPYDGTALIAAAHLGHDEVVRVLIRAHAPLGHVNNLGWTAVIESIVLGDGGKHHQATLQALIDAGANVNIGDRSGTMPLALARSRGYQPMVQMLTKAGAR